jgi:hypothetical protein
MKRQMREGEAKERGRSIGKRGFWRSLSRKCTAKALLRTHEGNETNASPDFLKRIGLALYGYASHATYMLIR